MQANFTAAMRSAWRLGVRSKAGQLRPHVGCQIGGEGADVDGALSVAWPWYARYPGPVLVVMRWWLACCQRAAVVITKTPLPITFDHFLSPSYQF